MEKQKYSDNDSRRIYLGGFGQGCMLAMSVFLRMTQPLGGVFCLNGLIPLAEKNFATDMKSLTA